MALVWDDFEVELVGFTPSHLAQSAIFETTNLLRDMCPSESFVKMTLSKTAKAFHGTIHITTAGCRDLTVGATDKSMQKLLKSLLTKMEKTMDDWHNLQHSKDNRRVPHGEQNKIDHAYI
jgi:hypothetical protein